MKDFFRYIKSILQVLSVFKIVSIVFMIVAIVCILVSISNNMYLENQQREMYFKDSMRQTSHNYKLQIDRYINNKINTLKYISTFPEIYNMDPKQQKKFLLNRSALLDFRHMFVMHKDSGECYYIEEGLVRNQKMELFFQDVMNNDVFLTQPWSDSKRYFSIITICVSIKDPDGNKLGALCGALDLSKIQDFIGANDGVLQDNYVLINRLGQYISGSHISSRTMYKNKNYFDQEDTDLSMIKEAIAEKTDKFGRFEMDGVEYYAYASYLPDYDWIVIQYIESDVLSKVIKDIRMLHYIMAILCILMLLTVFRVIIRWFNTNKRLFTDHLTGCRNRVAYEMKLNSLENSYSNEIAIIYMDLNNFKIVNDSFGHDNGDLLLKMFADILQNVFREIGTIYRVGGDEFVCIAINKSMETINEYCKKLNELLDEQSKTLTFDYKMSASYGYAVREKGCKDALHLILERADRSMYHYKHNWRRRNKL